MQSSNILHPLPIFSLFPQVTTVTSINGAKKREVFHYGRKRQKLGLWNIIGLGLGGAIGTGVFVLLGYGVAYTGRSISLVVTIGCFFMLLAYWYNLIMPSMFVLKGGDYSMKAMLFNPFMSGVSAWMILVNGLAMSSYAVALAQYLAIAVPALQIIRHSLLSLQSRYFSFPPSRVPASSPFWKTSLLWFW